MSANISTQSPFLRTSRSFPLEAQPLAVEISKSYVDIANFVNARTIGVYATNVPTITGNQWFISGANPRNVSLRQAYTFTAAGNIPHGINFINVVAFVQIYGSFTDGTNWYPLPYVDVVAANNQINLKVTPTNIVITAGAGSPPTITSGIVVLEWIGNT